MDIVPMAKVDTKYLFNNTMQPTASPACNSQGHFPTYPPPPMQNITRYYVDNPVAYIVPTSPLRSPESAAGCDAYFDNRGMPFYYEAIGGLASPTSSSSDGVDSLSVGSPEDGHHLFEEDTQFSPMAPLVMSSVDPRMFVSMHAGDNMSCWNTAIDSQPFEHAQHGDHLRGYGRFGDHTRMTDGKLLRIKFWRILIYYSIFLVYSFSPFSFSVFY